MKDIFTTHPLASFPALKFYICDLCGMKNPASHLADFNGWSLLCQPCADRIQKDSK